MWLFKQSDINLDSLFSIVNASIANVMI